MKNGDVAAWRASHASPIVSTVLVALGLAAPTWVWRRRAV
jgi:hypothetical protein